MTNKQVWFEPLNDFGATVAVAVGVAVATGREWRAENELALGPVSIPLFTVLFFVALLSAVRSQK